MYWLQLFDWYAASISVILICLVEIIIVGWIYGVQNFVRDVEFMIGHRVEMGWIVCWKYITPTILFVSMLHAPCHFIAPPSGEQSNIDDLHSQFIFITTICFNTEITYNGMVYPRWLIAIGWGSCLSSCSCIPIYIVYKLSRMNGSFRKVNIMISRSRPDSAEN